MKTEYAVYWKRVGLSPKRKVFKTRKGADDYLILFGPEPWKKYGRDPNERICCSGHECSCEGKTYRSESDEKRAAMPPLEWVAIRVRSVSEWVEESREVMQIPEEAADRDEDAGYEDHMANRMAGVKTGLDSSNDMDNFW